MQRTHLTLRRRLAAALAAAAVLAFGLVAAQNGEAIDVQGDVSFRLELVAEGFTAPLTVVSPPGDARRFVVDQAGVVWIIDEDGERLDEPFLDLRERVVELRDSFDERGLLSLAFHPQYASDGRFFVHYSAPLREGALAAMNHTGRVSEFRVSEDDENRADLDSERIIFEVDQPQFNHNGGKIAFGLDGYLYVALGDGGGANDTGPLHPPLGNAQDVSTVLGAILRLDVDAEQEADARFERAFGVPGDNPFVAEEVDLEEYDEIEWSAERPHEAIWAWGLRNPYRFSFDRETGDMWIADVGQNLWEAVYRTSEGGNFGWNIVEGSHGFDPDRPNEVLEPDQTEGPRGEEFVQPIIEYRNVRQQDDGRGISVIGGYVYRGSELPDLQGRYVFGDWSLSFGEGRGKIFVAGEDAEAVEFERGAADAADRWGFLVDHEIGHYVLGFGEDDAGELYVLTSDSTGPTGETGRVYRIVAADGDDDGAGVDDGEDEVDDDEGDDDEEADEEADDDDA
jgi:glucose/arabinose dehydrogenase